MPRKAKSGAPMAVDSEGEMMEIENMAASTSEQTESRQASEGRHVVAELDVCLAEVNGLLASSQVMGEKSGEPQRQRNHSLRLEHLPSGEAKAKGKNWRQVMLLQYPLRPQERPYPMQDVKDVRVKPQIQRIEVDVPICTESHNYEDRSLKQISTLTLRSSNVDLHTKYMVGVLKDGKLTLVPLDKAVQLRPKSFMEQPEVPTSNAIKQQVPQEDGLLTVRIERHETKKQIEARQRSHAYQRELEEMEPWLPLSASSTNSTKAKKVREEWAKAPTNMQQSSAMSTVGIGSTDSENAANYLDRLLARNQDEIV